MQDQTVSAASPGAAFKAAEARGKAEGKRKRTLSQLERLAQEREIVVARGVQSVLRTAFYARRGMVPPS